MEDYNTVHPHCDWVTVHPASTSLYNRNPLCVRSDRVNSKYPLSNLPFWLGIGAAQKGAGSKPIERRHWVASLIVGILGALLIAVGMFFLLVSQQ
jgi:hypothetical protein